MRKRLSLCFHNPPPQPPLTTLHREIAATFSCLAAPSTRRSRHIMRTCTARALPQCTIGSRPCCELTPPPWATKRELARASSSHCYFAALVVVYAGESVPRFPINVWHVLIFPDISLRHLTPPIERLLLEGSWACNSLTKACLGKIGIERRWCASRRRHTWSMGQEVRMVQSRPRRRWHRPVPRVKLQLPFSCCPTSPTARTAHHVGRLLCAMCTTLALTSKSVMEQRVCCGVHEES